MADELSGTLVQRVGIQTWVDLRDDAGAAAGYWQAAGAAYAAISADGGGAVVGEARRSQRRWRVTLRAPVAVSLTSRLLWNGAVLAVLAVENDPRQADRVVLRCQGREA